MLSRLFTYFMTRGMILWYVSECQVRFTEYDDSSPDSLAGALVVVLVCARILNHHLR